MDRWQPERGAVAVDRERATSAEAGPGASASAGPGPGPSVRLDRGHRWPGPGPRGAGRAAGGDEAGCCLVAPSREAAALAAMIDLVLGDDRGRVAAAGRGGLITVAGGAAGDPAGLVRWPAAVEVPDPHLLLHVEAGAAPSGWAGATEGYSLAPGADWWAGDVRSRAGCCRFRAYERGEYRLEVALEAPGAHLLAPALGAVAVGFRAGLGAGTIADRLAGYRGCRRNFAVRGTYRGVTLVDDEASGAGGIARALGLARELYGRRTIRAVYLAGGPGSGDVGAELALADHLLLVGRGADGLESTRLLAASLRSSGAAVICCSSLDMATRELDRYLEPGDVLVTLGAGEVGTIADAFLRRLRRDHHG